MKCDTCNGCGHMCELCEDPINECECDLDLGLIETCEVCNGTGEFHATQGLTQEVARA